MLPPLQGCDLDEHFHRIGLRAAHPWLSLANDFSTSELPPKPDHWYIQSGWTKYYYESDGSSYSEHVVTPEHNGQPEKMLAFDVETMPKYHTYAVIACAASKNAWYSWISPWLLNESSDPQHLIPLGDSNSPQVVIGHNVSYDRSRVLEEYSLKQTKRRFIDTMALHVAVNGISSHQRPAWMQYRKAKQKEQTQKQEAVEVVVDLMHDVDMQHEQEADSAKKEKLRRLRHDMEESLPLLQTGDSDAAEADITSKRWEDLTSANSLADVAKLHCGISMDKEIRNDFMTRTPSDILENINDYLNYCSGDVFTTHAVFAKVLPAFFAACPNPVSFAGILTMGSSFLTVNESWEAYLENAEKTYRELEIKVKNRLVSLAENAKTMMDSGEWRDDVWLSQLDWTPKAAGASRGINPGSDVCLVFHLSDLDNPEHFQRF
jgi:DNA polymerase gamma 1